MRNLAIKTTAILLFASMGSMFSQSKAQIKVQPQAKKESAKKKVYTFKTMQEKEMKAKAAYRKLIYNLKDASYPKDILELEKREMICIITAKVLEEKTS